MYRKILLSLILLGALLLSLSACQTGAAEEPLVGASRSGALHETSAGALMDFTVTVAHAGDPVGLDFRGVLTAGRVQMLLEDAEHQPVFQRTVDQPGSFAVNNVVYPQAGTYTLGLTWEGPVDLPQYELQWKPYPITAAQVTPLALLGGVGMVLVAAGYVAYAGKRRLNWGYLGLGALAWGVTVALKFLWAVPLNAPIYNALTGALPESIAMPLFYIYVGLLTGMTEVLLTWLVVRYTRLGQVPWGKALAFGIGFGAVEALLLGFSSLSSIITALAMPEALPTDVLTQLAAANNPLWGVAPIVERFFTCLIHIFCNVALFYGAVKKEARWFWLSFLFKSGIDAVAAFAQLWGLTELWRIWLIEALVVVWGLLGWWGARWVREHYPAGAATEPEAVADAPVHAG
ncbi:MAG TPA: YhfC family glutamic-type intramembrane protease [Anaerolineae bacterium]|nr:YhfC family glutamic-type intramembrane protease [Anaerolineae bacterium]HQE98124.1 YhfC family glutamic-type intramembrane protease [Anaerolineae bacterium]HQJ10366.1 YhfC family glutamic-type intramembrane protease [Anaerolineae bacterium]HUM35252.1 YhfC family glutamic-type intramembrane protease [Anaerolineae bacterium]